MSRNATGVLIVGTGIAGLCAALTASASGRQITLITKTADPTESNTRYAQGGIVDLGVEDSPGLLAEDITKAGDGICNPAAVDLVVREGPRLVHELLIDQVGVEFSTDRNGRLDYTREAAHSRKRILHYYDMTGLEIERKLLDRVRDIPNVCIRTGCTAIDLITTHHNTTNHLLHYRPNRCLGCHALDNRTGQVHTLLADATVLATGGIGRLYQYTTNPPSATADGISMAYRAGAEVINMEYVQFHPTVFYTEGGEGFLISESVRGEGGRLINRDGEPFMERYSPQWKDLAPRDEVARAIYTEMARTGSSHVLLDVAGSYRGEVPLRERFPGIYRECLKHKVDLETEPIPVVPAEHYFCGGVLVGERGRTTLPGLWVVGEASCSGVHGANRLASVSLLESLVYGVRAGAAAAEEPGHADLFDDMEDWIYPSRAQESSQHDPLLVLQDWNVLRSTMWSYVGIIRTQARLQRAVSDLRNLHTRVSDYYRDTPPTRERVELRNGITVATMIAESARRNRRTTGCHYLEDGTRGPGC
ncbi:MAG: L-aspartate oxidase [Spirochaetota bacterium]